MQGKAAGPFLHNIIGVIMRVEALKNRAVAPDPGVYLGDEEDIWKFFYPVRLDIKFSDK